MSKSKAAGPVADHLVVAFLKPLGKRTALERLLAVLAHCALLAPNESVELGWVCKVLEAAGYGRPNTTLCRAHLKSARGIRKKGASSYIMSADKAADVLASLGVESEPRDPAVNAAPQSGGRATSADVCIVCALVEVELDAVVAALGLQKVKPSSDDPSTYYEGTLSTTDGSAIRIAAAAATNMGLAASAILTTKMLIKYRPRLVAMPGIIGGTSHDGAGFGDVIIARQTIDYRSGKVSQSAEGALHFAGSAQPLSADPRLIDALEHSKTEIELALVAAKKKFQGNASKSEWALRFGDVASGDQVVSSATIVKEQLASWRKLLGIEMETYAVHRACRDAISPQPVFLSCKAVSDSTFDKTSEWRKFAAYMSAAFVRHFLENFYKDVVAT